MLQATTNINIDFYDKKHILINAKQLDRDSRFLSITCYNHGELYSLNSSEHAVYVRYRKADNYGVFNNCDINNSGKIIVKLTEQMLATDGICYADLVIVNKGEAEVNPNTGEINELIANASVLSTMTFCIDVNEIPVANSDVESTYEFILLNENLEKYWADFENVMKTSKSWAVGDTGIRDDENTDNSKYWATQSKNSANASNTSALNAAESERIAGEYKDTAIVHSNNAYTYMADARKSMNNANESEANAKTSEINAAASEANAASSETNAANSEANASKSEANAKTSEKKTLASEKSARTSEVNALNSANKAQSYAVGGTGTRTDEDYDNAHYYYNLTKNIVIGLDTGFIPMGTVSFSELTSVEKATGYVYNIKDDFITDESFREGSGKSYTAGTNVYYTANGQWDCFGGAASPTATVSEVKDYLGI